MDKEILESLRSVVDYDWETERRDYEDYPSENHVFLDLQRLDAYLVSRGY